MSEAHQPFMIDLLTDREEEILRLMASGLSNRDIAENLVISFETVRWYTKQIYSKLGVNSRAQAIIRAGEVLDRDTSPTAEALLTLPAYPLSFVGRQQELQEIGRLLADPNVRLLTIAGLGGMGKTRLSIEAARQNAAQFSDGIFFIPWSDAGLTGDPFLAIVRGMNLQSGTDSRHSLLHYLEGKAGLFILDNFDPAAHSVEVITDLLQQTRRVKLLITARASLNVREEWVRYLEGFTFPKEDVPGQLETYDAVQLFLERARRFRADFSLDENRSCVVEICRLVDGMPLAIELACTWLKTLGCRDVLREIERSIDFLIARERDVDDRHRSIRAVFDYSWNLLSDEEQRVFQRLSMFRGGFGYEAARQVAGATVPLLSNLIDKSLLYRNSRGWYEIHGLLRQYAGQRLERIATDAMSTRSSMVSAWASLVKGNFERVREIAGYFLDNKDDHKSIYEEAFGLSLLGVLAGMDEDYLRALQLCEASQNLFSQHDEIVDPIAAVFTHLGLAIAFCGTGSYPLARQQILAALQVASELHVPAFVTLCLPVVAIILAHEVEVERAIEVMALAFTHPASTPTWMEEWPVLVRLRADLRLELGAESFGEIWNRGIQADLETVMHDFGQGTGEK
ncbi:MAG: LuxR C-terminal-related transcriptional regulator [Anaerolineae bacterium]|nr:LuxR C-terminal-related transcriptional regulator [Anaerolineae bacterium]